VINVFKSFQQLAGGKQMRDIYSKGQARVAQRCEEMFSANARETSSLFSRKMVLLVSVLGLLVVQYLSL
jgi:hypothetical protein